MGGMAPPSAKWVRTGCVPPRRLWPSTFEGARHGFAWSWVSKVLAFNLACELVFYGAWHRLFYGGTPAAHERDPLRKFKYNKTEQYTPSADTKGKVFQSSHLDREVVYTTLGFLMSTAYQAGYMRLLASVSDGRGWWWGVGASPLRQRALHYAPLSCAGPARPRSCAVRVVVGGARAPCHT